MPRTGLSIAIAAVLLAAAGGRAAHAQAGADFCRTKQEHPGIMQHFGVPSGQGGPAPFGFSAPIGRVSPSQIMRSMGGYYCDSPNLHPAIYAIGGGLTVVGPDYERTFRYDQTQEAFAAYEALLRRFGLGAGR